MISHLKIYALLTLLFSFIAGNTKNILLQHSDIQKLYKQLESEFKEICYSPQFEIIEQPTLRQARIRNLPQSMALKKLEYKEPLPAYDKAVLISMVKDEADIIAENLAWHYFMGFRKFIIIDNGSTDNTPQLIDSFKELTSSSATVIKIDDPEIAYTQPSRINACVKLAESLFPEISWIFPNDADEFIILDAPLQEILSSIPPEINCIFSPRITYIPTNDYFTHNNNAKFYERMHRAHKRNPYGYHDSSGFLGKTFMKAHQGLWPIKGNHMLSNMSLATPTYISALEVGMHIREFPLRSPEHALKKIVNIGIAELERRKMHSQLAGTYYADTRYERYLEIGDAVGKEEFIKFMKTGGYSFDEQMPIELALQTVISLSKNQKRLPTAQSLAVNCEKFNDHYDQKIHAILPDLAINFIFGQGLSGEAGAIAHYKKCFLSKGIECTLTEDFSNSKKQNVIDVMLALCRHYPLSTPSKYTYLISHTSINLQYQQYKEQWQHEKIFKRILQIGKNCYFPDISLYNPKKDFYFTIPKSPFHTAALNDATIFFCGGIWDGRYDKCLSILDTKDFFNWYGLWLLNTRKSYKGYSDDIVKSIRQHKIALILHSKHHLNNEEPTLRIFEAAAAGAVIISDRNQFIIDNFGDSILYVNQNDSEEEMAQTIIKHYEWIKKNPLEALKLAQRAHAIFIEKFTLEDQALQFVQMHQETLVMDGQKPLPPRGPFSHYYKKSDLKLLNNLLKILMPQTFYIENTTSYKVNHVFSLSMINAMASEEIKTNELFNPYQKTEYGLPNNLYLTGLQENSAINAYEVESDGKEKFMIRLIYDY